MKHFKFMAALVFLLVMFFHANVMALWINNVEIAPEIPSISEAITFKIYGTASARPSWVVHEVFSQNETSILLDLYVDTGIQAMFSDWSYSKQILPLTAGMYNLEVRAFDNDYEMLHDTYALDFIVTPEPCTLAFLGLGLPFIKRIS